jgi:hypothetical protein
MNTHNNQSHHRHISTCTRIRSILVLYRVCGASYTKDCQKSLAMSSSSPTMLAKLS